MKNLVMRFVKDEEGATAIEYGLIAALVALAIITALTQLGTDLGATFTNVSNGLTGATGGAGGAGGAGS